MQIVPPSGQPAGGDPAAPASDAQRDTAVDILQRVVGQGRLTLGEFVDRLDVVIEVRTRVEVDAVIADLPRDAPLVGPSTPATAYSIFGDVAMRGR